MALDKDALATTIGDAMIAKWPPPDSNPPEIKDMIRQSYRDFGRIIGDAIIDHFVANAEVTPDGTPALEAGGDPVTGKGKIA